MPDDEPPEQPATPQPPVTPKPAATVMLVRDRAGGVEVFLLERSGFGHFGGLHVFPGGKVDPSDHDASWGEVSPAVRDRDASATLGLASGGLGYWVACIRECFEEAGVLLAAGRQGRTLPFTDPVRRARFAEWRHQINAGDTAALLRMCEQEELVLSTDRLAYVSHWITPVDQPARFDTRFFVAQAPFDQEALHDGHEAVASEWIRPEVALERFARGELNLISPTQSNLEAIAGFGTTDALLRAKRSVDPATIPTILPRIRARADLAQGFEELLEVVGYGGEGNDQRPIAAASKTPR